MNWYCVHTKPGKEPLVERYLSEELGLESYFPKLKRKKTIRRVRREVLEPLFPRYLFCRLDISTSFRAVRYGKNVIDVVSAGGQPTIVSETTIDQLKNWAGTENDVIAIAPEPIAPGDTIKITEGPMQGLEAIFLEETSQGDRVAILLDLMNSEARAEIDRSQIEPIGH